MLPSAASSAAAARRPAALRPQLSQSRSLQRQQHRAGRLLTSVQAPGAAPAPLAPEDDSQDSEIELSVRPVQGQEQPAALPTGRAVEGLLPHHWEEHLRTLQAPERRDLGRYIALVRRINALRDAMAALSDDELAAKTGELRYRIEAAGLGGPDPGSSPGEILSGSGDGIYASPDGSSRERRRAQAAEWRRRGLLGGLPEDVVVEGFAVVREAAHRVLGMRHYDVQLLGGLVLQEGQVAEMRTGEGKTLVATLPAYVNALTGRGVHIITVNGYLAQRDAEWIGKVFKFLGLSVGVLAMDSSTIAQRIAALACDITYTTAYDLAFTYLQDNTSQSPHDVAVRRPLHFALVDEADSLLIDEAINPFVISGPLLDAHSQGARWAEALAVARTLTHHAVENPAIGEQEWQALEREYDCLLRPQYMSATLSNRGMLAAVQSLAERGTVRCCQDAKGRLVVALVNPVGSEQRGKGITAGNGSRAGNARNNQPAASGSSEEGKSDGGSIEGKRDGSSIEGKRDGSSKGDGAPEAATGTAAAATNQPVRLVLLYATLPDGSAARGGSQAIADIQLASAGQIEDELEKRGLQELPAGDVTRQHLEAAMPAALWSGPQAWGAVITTALRALHCYIKDMHYIVDQAAMKVVLIDQGTGRERVKSKWQAGIHQAVEAKEGLPVSAENFTTASISFQSLFGYYRRLAGMTGTAITEQQELAETYGLQVLRVPPHRPSVRRDEPLQLYLFQEGRDKALLTLLLQAQQKQQPVLIGAGTVEESAQLHAMISRKLQFWRERTAKYGLTQDARVELLNARPETVRREATIIAQAGLPGSVTIATALAGRGTDILLGGNPKGLVQMLLENRLLERLAGPAAGDLDNYDRRLPLANLSLSLLDLHEFDELPLDRLAAAAADPASISRSFNLQLPPEVCSAYCELRAALAAVLPQAAGAEQPQLPVLPPLVSLNGAAAHNGASSPPPKQQQHSGDAGEADAAGTTGAPGAVSAAASLPPPAHLPWRRYGGGQGKRAAQHAADWLSQQLEAAEMQKAQLRLSECLQFRGPAAFQEAARRIKEAEQQQQQGRTGGGDARLAQFRAALQRFILLQWLWFDRMCAVYARKVRAAGGLRVIIASLPDTKRSELQLRGRAGRQGDPGVSHLILSLDDPVLAVRDPGLGSLSQAVYERTAWAGTGYNVAKYREHLRHMADTKLKAMQRDPRFTCYHVLDAEEDPQYLAEYNTLSGSLPIGDLSIKHVISQYEFNRRNARSTVREYDQVMDRYRRHLYTLRRVLLQGGAAGRQSLLHSAFMDAAHNIVSRLIDADQPPHHWPLKDVVQWLEAVVNSCPPGEAGSFNGSRWLAQSNTKVVLIRLDMRPDETAQQLSAALQSGTALPQPQLIDLSLAGDGAADQSQWKGKVVSAKEMLEMLPELHAQQARAAAGRPRLRERQAAALLRAQLGTEPGSRWLDADGSSAVLGDIRGLTPPLQGRYAAAARQLAAWAAEQLVAQHRNRREVLKHWYRVQHALLPVADAVIEDLLLVRERALLLTRLDAIWAGFLDACERKKHEVLMRSFASYNPMEEYELETSQLFAQLLLDLKQAVVTDTFRDVGLLSLESAAGASRSSAAEDEDGKESGSSGSGSGRGKRRATGGGWSLEAEAAGAAEDLGALFDQLGLGARVAAEAERLAAAEEAQRRAAAAAAEAAAHADVDAAEAAYMALDSTISACTQLLSLVLQALQQRNDTIRQLPLSADQAALSLVRQADRSLRDAVSSAQMCLDGPARSCEHRELDVAAAVSAWEMAVKAGDSAGMEAAGLRLRQLRQEAEADQKRADGLTVRATVLVDQAKTLLTQAAALPPRGSGSGGKGSGSNNGAGVVRAQESPAVAAMLAEGEDTAQQMEALLAALRTTLKPAAQQPASAPDPSAVALSAAATALAATKLGQMQQQLPPGSTDLPSAVLAAARTPRQASSAAIDAALMQAASPVDASLSGSSSWSEQAAAAAELKAQAAQLTPEKSAAVTDFLLSLLSQSVLSSASTGEALAKVQQLQQLPPGQQLAPPSSAQQQAEQVSEQQRRQDDQP